MSEVEVLDQELFTLSQVVIEEATNQVGRFSTMEQYANFVKERASEVIKSTEYAGMYEPVVGVLHDELTIGWRHVELVE